MVWVNCPLVDSLVDSSESIKVFKTLLILHCAMKSSASFAALMPVQMLHLLYSVCQYHGTGAGILWSLRSIPTQAILCFCCSKYHDRQSIEIVEFLNCDLWDFSLCNQNFSCYSLSVAFGLSVFTSKLYSCWLLISQPHEGIHSSRILLICTDNSLPISFCSIRQI